MARHRHFNVLTLVLLLFALIFSATKAQSPPIPQPPLGREGGPVQVGDRVYSADQVSNTVSVIDPATNTLLGTIPLGSQQPDDLLGPLYNQPIGVHGLGFSPDGRWLAVVSVTSNSITIVETATNQIRGTIAVGRAPHEGFFTPDGSELWVAVRGEDYISVVDPEQLRETARILTVDGVSMVAFRPDGRIAFANSSRTAAVDVIDVPSRTLVARIPVESPFSPNLLVTPDGTELWLTHKDVGKVSVINANSFEVKYVLDTGRVTNHVNFVSKQDGDYAYVSVGGEDVVRVIKRGDPPRIVANIQVGATPHGIWPSPDSSRVYVGLEDGDAVQVIDTATDHVMIATIPVGQAPQGLVYVARGGADASSSGLSTQGFGLPVRKFSLQAVGTNRQARGEAVVRRLAGVDQLVVSVEGLGPGDYRVVLAEAARPPIEAAVTVVGLSVSGEGRTKGQALMQLFDQALGERHLDHLLILGSDGEVVLSDGGSAGAPGPLRIANP